MEILIGFLLTIANTVSIKLIERVVKTKYYAKRKPKFVLQPKHIAELRYLCNEMNRRT